MKYNYIKPEIEVLEIEQKQVILTVSDDEEPEQSGWVGAPELLPDEEEFQPEE